MSVIIKQILPPVLLSESPYWDVKTQSLIYVDIFGSRIINYNPVTQKSTSAKLDIGFIYAVVGVEGRSDQFVVATDKDIYLVDWDPKSDVDKPPVKKLAKIHTTTGDAFNDAKCDSHGRFWTGTKGEYDENFKFIPNQGLIYCLDADLNIKEKYGPISIGNGICWNSEDTIFYYIDSLSKEVWSFDFDAKSGTIANKKVVFDLKENGIIAIPDGITIDTDDNLWVACFGAGGIANIDPRTGKMLRFVEMPIPQVSCVAFGGPNMDVMYVTSGDVPTLSLIDVETKGATNGGAVFSIKGLGVKGRPHYNFKMK